MNDAPTWIQAISAVAQSVIALATLLLSLVLWRSSQRHSRVDYTRTLQESWNQLNAAILTNPKLAIIADSVFGISADGVAEDVRARRYFMFFALNVLEASYLGQRAGLVDDTYHIEGITDILDPLLRESDTTKLLRVGGYHTAFVTFCEQRMATLSSDKGGVLMKADELPKPTNAQLPQGYHQGVVTAITVFLGFSLSFVRFWGIENPGEWTWKGIISASILGIGILVELLALFRSLELRDDEPLRYRITVRWFFGGVAIVILGVFVSIIVAA